MDAVKRHLKNIHSDSAVYKCSNVSAHQKQFETEFKRRDKLKSTQAKANCSSMIQARYDYLKK